MHDDDDDEEGRGAPQERPAETANNWRDPSLRSKPANRDAGFGFNKGAGAGLSSAAG